MLHLCCLAGGGAEGVIENKKCRQSATFLWIKSVVILSINVISRMADQRLSAQSLYR